MFQKILLIVLFKVKGTVVTFRMTMEPTECLLALTRHVAQHELLLTTSKLTDRHRMGGF